MPGMSCARHATTGHRFGFPARTVRACKPGGWDCRGGPLTTHFEWWLMEISPWIVVYIYMYIHWLVVTGTWLAYCSIYWDFHHPNWRTHIFQRGSNHQPVYIYIYVYVCLFACIYIYIFYIDINIIHFTFIIIYHFIFFRGSFGGDERWLIDGYEMSLIILDQY